MSLLNRIRNRSRIGRATGNRRLRAEGLADQVSGGARQFGEDVKSELKKAGRVIERTFAR